MKVYEYSNHRTLVRGLIQQAKKDHPDLTLGRIAEASGITPSFLSQVLGGDHEFSNDQIFMIGRFFKLDEDELEYLVLLNEYHRCSLQERRRDLKRDLEKIQDAHLRVVEYIPYDHIDTGSTPMDDLLCDTAATLMEAHFVTEENLKDPLRVKKKMGLSDEDFARGLGLLEKARFIESDGKGYRRVVGETMIYKINVAAKFNAVYSRLKAVEKLFANDPSDLIGTLVFCANDDFVQKTKARLLEFLNQALDEAEKDEDRDEVYFVNLDLFPMEGGA